MGKIQNSGQNLFYDPGFLNTGKPLVKALITEGEFLVVNAKLIEDGGVQVTNMDWIFQNIVGVIVGFAVFVSPLDACPGHPRGETPAMVVTTVVILGEFSLRVYRPSKFTAADHKSVIEHAAFLQVLDKSRAGLIDIFALLAKL